MFDGNEPAWFEKLLDGRGAVSFGRCVGLLLPKPAEGDGGVLPKGSELRGADGVDNEFEEKFEEGSDAEGERDEPGSVACD